MEINNRIISKILEGDMHNYFSVDQQDTERDEDALEMPIEFIYKLLSSGYPPHKLKLKIGTIVIVLRDLSTHEGIVNEPAGLLLTY